MMKQPAENTNASPEDQRKAAERSTPPARELNRDEIADVARELWTQRGETGGSPEEDWFLAEQIVRQRRAATSGNPSLQCESYFTGAGVPRTSSEEAWKEQKRMENMTGTMENTGTMSGAMDKARDTANRYMEQARQNLQDEPQSYPRSEHREGRIARTIEQQTAKLPSDTWLWAAVGSMGLSLALELSGKEKTANFVGHWVPTLLIFGLYNKLVKLQGSDGV
jgi:hypothetical protein